MTRARKVKVVNAKQKNDRFGGEARWNEVNTRAGGVGITKLKRNGISIIFKNIIALAFKFELIKKQLTNARKNYFKSQPVKMVIIVIKLKQKDKVRRSPTVPIFQRSRRNKNIIKIYRRV
jgi:hypothetical protein